MRLHYIRMVLATIVWTTLLLDGSCEESTGNKSNEDAVKAHGSKWMAYNPHSNKNDDGSPARPNDETSSIVDTADTRIMRKNVMVDGSFATVTERKSLTPEDVNRSASVAQLDGKEKKIDSAETSNHDHYHNEELDVPQLDLRNSHNDCDSISQTENGILQRVKNRAGNIPKDINRANGNNNEGEFYEKLWMTRERSVANDEKTNVADKNKAEKNVIFARGKFRDRKNNVDEIGGVSDTQDETRMSFSPGRLVDNPVNPSDSTRMLGIFGRFVENPFDGSEMINRRRKTLITGMPAKEVNLRREFLHKRKKILVDDQMHRQHQQRRKPERNNGLTKKMGSPGENNDGFVVYRKNVTMAIVNSKGFSQMIEAQRGNKSLNSTSKRRIERGPLARPSTKLDAIDRSRPEARVERTIHPEKTLESIQEAIFVKPKTKDWNPYGRQLASRPSRSGGLSGPDGSVTLASALRLSDENPEHNSASNPDDKSFPSSLPSEINDKLESPSLNLGQTDNSSRTRFPRIRNNAGNSLRAYGNFVAHAVARTSLPSGGDELRKSVDYEEPTESPISSRKTDSLTRTIDEPLYRAAYSVGKVPPSHYESGPSVNPQGHGKSPNNAFRKPIKDATAGSTWTFVAARASRRFPRDADSATVTPTKLQDVEQTGTIAQTTEDVVVDFERFQPPLNITETRKSLNSITTVPRGPTAIRGAALTDGYGVTSVTGNHNGTMTTLAESSDREKLFTTNEPESANFGKPQTKHGLENASFVIGVGIGKQTFNYPGNDNSTQIAGSFNQWPVKYNAIVEGDLVLGGLMMVHEREDSVTCGPVMPQGGVQALEAMLYTLDWVNERDLVPGVRIGAHILDDCDKDTYGLEMAVDFIKGSISNIDGAEYHCNKTTVRKVISGVVGAASSVTSIQVANLLRLFRIPQVSFFSTSPELSNKMRFEYFTRTIPSDHYQVKAMVDIVRTMNWSYVSIIYEESNYGEKAYEELEKLLGHHHICIAVKEKLSKDSGVAQAHVYDNIVQKLLKKPMARGCIIFASDQEVAGVMRAVRRCNATGSFSWIGSDGWSARSLVSEGNEPEVEGTLSVQPQANPVRGFENYFLNLTVENNRRNPWFVEFWEDHFKCRYPNATQTPYNNYTNVCTTHERLTKQNTAFENQLQFVSDAVMAFAYAFRTMHAELCNGNRGLCDRMKPTKGTELLNYLKRVEFKGLSGDVFRFDKNGDGPARYNIIHFKQITRGKYEWIRVGEYLEGELRLNMSDIQFRLEHPQPPESVCSLPCEVGQAKKYVEGESCCWHCFNCTQYQIRHVEDERQCVLCPQGTVPDDTHSYCRDIPENFLRPESGWAIGAMSFSSTGILITLFVGGVFLKHNDTPIVRASGRELSYVLLTGILLCYLVTFALVLRPNDIVCSIQRFSAGFCFTVVYAALLTKTNRISRIFNAGKHSAKRPSFISPRSQLIICTMLVSVQILINGVWMVIDPARAMHHYPTREDNLLVCNSYIDASYMIAFTYPIMLIVVCTLYAVLTRKIPEAFNESKHIGFTMYTTCIIWLAFVPLYFATGSQVALRITSMSVTISLSASVTIACLFTPKLYIILIHPERNVRPNMMMTRYNTTKGSVVTATNASSMLAPVTLTAVTCDQNKAVNKHVIATTDCSTQSEQLEMETKDPKNDKITTAVVSRSTQTHTNNNAQECETMDATSITDVTVENNIVTGSKGLNTGKMGNGPLNQNEVTL